jgi:hypothetical protein
LLAESKRLACDCLSLRESFRAQGGQFQLSLGKVCALANALLALCFCCCALLLNGKHATLQICVEAIDALEGSLCTAAALFEPSQFGGQLCRLDLQSLTLLPQSSKLRLQLIQGRLSGGALSLEAYSLLTLLLNYGVLALAGFLVARSLQSPFLEASFDALSLSFHLLQCGALICGIALSSSALLAPGFQLGGQVFDGSIESSGFHLGLREIVFQQSHAAFGLAQFPL